jgi:acyl carrier protein
LSDNDAALSRIFQQIFGVPAEEAQGVSMESHPVWDSMAHINLILAVEQHFRIALTPDDAALAVSYEALRDLVDQKA